MWHILLSDLSDRKGTHQIRPIENPFAIGGLLKTDKTQTVPNSLPTIQTSDPDLTNPAAVFRIHSKGSQETYWAETTQSLQPFKIGGLKTSRCEIPIAIPIKLGNIQFQLVKNPDQGEARRSYESRFFRQRWETCTPAGFATLRALWIASKSELPVYLEGETGTGKDLMARMLHDWTPVKRPENFVIIHCGALTPSLAESELFGHIKGAFTGAHRNRIGALTLAHGGTLFLDEIGDLSLDLQVKLLRFLENGEVKSVGSDRPQYSKARIVCATHKPLATLVEQGLFREDLYYRLTSIPIRIPPLRERPDDILLLAARFAESAGFQLMPCAGKRLRTQSWFGNGRQLKNTIYRACASNESRNHLLTADSLEENTADWSHYRSNSAGPSRDLPLVPIRDLERQLILKALRVSSGNRTQAAKTIGVARSTLNLMIQRYEIRPIEFNPPEAWKNKARLPFL